MHLKHKITGKEIHVSESQGNIMLASHQYTRVIAIKKVEHVFESAPDAETLSDTVEIVEKKSRKRS